MSVRIKNILQSKKKTGEYVLGGQLEYFGYLKIPPCGFPDPGLVYIVRGYAIYNSMIAYSLSVYAIGMRESKNEIPNRSRIGVRDMVQDDGLKPKNPPYVCA